MEILIILAVALIFVGPDQLPKVARQIGKGVRQVRGAVGKVDDEMRRAVREAAAEFDDDGNPLADPPKRDTSPAVAGTARALTPADAGPGEQTAAVDAPLAVANEGEAAPHPTTANAPPRDWSQVGKAPVAGAVAQVAPKSASVTPARPTEAAPAEASDVTDGPEAAKT